MPRRMSDVEWSTFLTEVDIDTLDLPPWGGVVEWAGMDVLVFVGPGGEVFLTDVSEYSDQWRSEINARHDPSSEVWYWQLPEVTVEILAERAMQVDAAVNTAAESLQFATSPLFVSGMMVLGLFLLTRRAG